MAGNDITNEDIPDRRKDQKHVQDFYYGDLGELLRNSFSPLHTPEKSISLEEESNITFIALTESNINKKRNRIYPESDSETEPEIAASREIENWRRKGKLESNKETKCRKIFRTEK